MKSLYTNAAGLLASLLVGLTLLLTQTASAAPSASLSLDPSTASYAVGSTFTVTVHENSQSAAINAVQADLTYDQSALQFVNVGSTGLFDVDAASTGGSGKVSIARAKLQTSLTGDQSVASITFKVLTASGASAVDFAATSAVVQTSNHQNIWDNSSHGGSYSLTASGPVVQSSGGTSTTPNSVAIKVMAAGNQAVGNAKITLDGSSPVATDATGVASFPNVTPGQHTVTVAANGQTKSESITVKPQTPKALQQFNVRLAPSSNKTSAAWYIGGLMLVLVAGAIVIRLLHRPPTLGITPSAQAKGPKNE